MAQLIVRGVDDDLKRRLQARAACHGQSMEAELRDILSDALKDDRQATEGLGTRISRRFAGCGLQPGEELEKPNWEEVANPLAK